MKYWRVGTLALLLAVAAAGQELNPLVPRSPEVHGTIPADCAVSGAAPMTRIDVGQAEEPAMPLPPVRPAGRKASGEIVEELRAALARNDRPAFDAALARAKAAGEPVRVYEDIAVIWDAQFESPFFAQDSTAYRIASAYPGYEAAVRSNMFTDASGKKFYPAAESRAFLAKQAGASARPTTRTTARTATRTTKSAPTKPARTTSKPATRKPAAPKVTATPPRSPDPSAPPPTVAATESAPAVAPVVETSSTVAPPAAESIAPPPEPAPIATVETTATAPPPTTTTAAQSSGATRSIILPAILILIGVGVLIVLFRTAK